MTELDSVQQARAKAMTSIRSAENEAKLMEYAVPEMGVAVFGVYPAGAGPAGVIVAYLSRVGRNVTQHTYRSGERFRKSDLEGRKVLAVKESSLTNGMQSIAKAAEDAIQKGYMAKDDFRLLYADTFTMLTVDDLLRELKEQDREPSYGSK